MGEFDRCLQPDFLETSGGLYLLECSDDPLQKFTLTADGMFQTLADGAALLCVAVAPGEGVVINPIHKRRELVIESCSDIEPDRSVWLFTDSLNLTIPGG